MFLGHCVSIWLSATGIVLVLLGSWLVAYEVVNRFLNFPYRVVGITVDGSGKLQKNPDFSKWEIKRAVAMWMGLGFITAGSFLQLAGLFKS